MLVLELSCAAPKWRNVETRVNGGRNRRVWCCVSLFLALRPLIDLSESGAQANETVEQDGA